MHVLTICSIDNTLLHCEQKSDECSYLLFWISTVQWLINKVEVGQNISLVVLLDSGAVLTQWRSVVATAQPLIKM